MVNGGTASSVRNSKATRWFVFLHIIELGLIFAGLWAYKFLDLKPYAVFAQKVPVSRLEMAKQNPDALQIAYSVGVLEFISISLTILGILIALGALVGFWIIRGEAIREADKAAEREVATRLPLLAKQWFEKEGRAIIAETAVFVQGNGVPNIMSESETGSAIENSREIRGDL